MRVFARMDYECNKNPTELFVIPYIYSGVMTNVRYIRWANVCGISGELSTIDNMFHTVTIPFRLINLAVSFVSDTVMLPFTITMQIMEGNIIDPPYFAIARIYVQKVDRMDDDKAIEYFEKGINVLPKYFGENNYGEADLYLSDLEGAFYKLGQLYDKKGNQKKALYYKEHYNKIKEYKRQFK